MKKLIPLVERLFSLLVVFLLLAATTLWSGKFFGHNWLEEQEKTENIEQMVVSPTSEELKMMDLSGMTLVPRDSISWNVVGQDQKRQGVVISSMPFTEEIIGYAGTTPLFVYIDDDGNVKGVATMENDETPSFFKRAANGILDRWDGLSVSKALDLQVDAVSGATYTSHSLVANVKAVLAAYASADMMSHRQPSIGWARTIVLFVVFGLGMLVAWRYRGIKWLRLLVLALNVGITGFWCGQFLSVFILHSWIQNGVDVMLYLPTVVMLILAIVMPYIGKRNHYCMWMCPYGSLQELAWQLPLPKVKVGAKVYKWMSYIRMTVLMLLLMALWMGYGLSLLDYEPFSAFIISTAAPGVMILAGIFVLVGIFIPHPWCQCVCPLGALLNLAEEKK